MLDQNTDRMWYVIGAVLVGAAIILIANGTLPQIFASVTNSFENVASSSIDSISSINGPINLFNESLATKGSQLNVQGDQHHGVLGELAGDGWDAISHHMRVEEGRKYTFSTNDPTVVKRIAFFDENKVYLDGWKKGGVKVFTVDAPDNSVYARISTDYNPLSTAHSPMDTWWFGTYDHYLMLKEGE